MPCWILHIAYDNRECLHVSAVQNLKDATVEVRMKQHLTFFLGFFEDFGTVRQIHIRFLLIFFSLSLLHFLKVKWFEM